MNFLGLVVVVGVAVEKDEDRVVVERKEEDNGALVGFQWDARDTTVLRANNERSM